MSETLNADILKTEFNVPDMDDEDAEAVLMSAIRLLNTFSAGVTQLSGAAGSRTGSYSSSQMGAVMAMSQQIFSKHYKNPSSVTNKNTGQLSLGYSNDTQLLSFAKTLAAQLVGRSFKRA
jgi:hypothetical protein